MKSIFKYTIAALPLTLTLTACNDSYLERFPETSITEKVFFQNVGDLETYTNGFYGAIGCDYWDGVSDNLMCINDESLHRRMRGEVYPETSGTWSWSSIRSVNFMLARVNNVQGDQAEINHFIGLARMIRAKYYYDKVKTYNDVPWYSRDLQTTDTEELYKTQDPRALVVDSIMADLQFAVEHMKDGSGSTRMMRSTALAMQARIALHEGTFRKYHKELGLNDGDNFLRKAAEAASQIMDMGKYSLSQISFQGLAPYQSLFCNTDLSSNPEMILFDDYDLSLGRLNNAQAAGAYHGLSRDLMEDYLVVENGKTRTFQSLPGYATMTYGEIFENRDPRMRQTFKYPGYQRANASKPDRIVLTNGGYQQIKFDPQSYDQISWDKSYVDLPKIRYAEILLIYAEAKAELGILTQDDLDRTINLIRRRVNMPEASLAEWLGNIDPVQAERYSNVESTQRGAVLEIRRERRIELACEGFRYDDLMRWSLGKLLAKNLDGMYIPGPGLYDVTGDGEPDIAVALDAAGAASIPQEDRDRYSLTVYTLEGNTIALTEGDHGYVYLISQHDRFTFEEPKYYYSPVAVDDITLNPNLVQNKYWAK